jgi:hypothetical protein
VLGQLREKGTPYGFDDSDRMPVPQRSPTRVRIRISSSEISPPRASFQDLEDGFEAGSIIGWYAVSLGPGGRGGINGLISSHGVSVNGGIRVPIG